MRRMSRSQEGTLEPLMPLDDDLECDEPCNVAVKVESAVFSWSEYSGFFIIGLSMMWTWSMILQAIPYLQRRFRQDAWVLRYFQAFYLVFFAITMSIVTMILSFQKGRASYTGRLRISLIAYVTVATMLMLSTIGSFNVGANLYFPFTLAMVIVTAVANGLSQNAAFAFAASFGRTEYAPAIMTGEALAGLLPSAIEIISALAFPSYYFDITSAEQQQTSVLTLGYFLSAALIGLASLNALRFLKARSHSAMPKKPELTIPKWKRISKTLKWPALANFLCLCLSSVSPVFQAKITSVVSERDAPLLLRPDVFIPLAIMLWNIGELAGSVFAASSKFLLKHPVVILILSCARIVFIPLYLMCNVDGRGSFAGDWFYLLVVQLGFGLSHGWLSSASMMGVPEWVAKGDREEAGAFMGMTLVSGLVVGSLLGVVVARA